MAKELSGYGPTAGESMGGTGANLNQQGGNNNSNSGVHWGGGSGSGNGGREHGSQTGWGWSKTNNPDVPPYVDDNGQVRITITNGLVKTPVYGVPGAGGNSDVQGGYIPENPNDEVARKWDKNNLPREIDVSIDGFKYRVTLNDNGRAIGILRTAVRPYVGSEKAKAGIMDKVDHKTPEEIYEALGFNNEEPLRQDQAKKAAYDVFYSFSMNRDRIQSDVLNKAAEVISDIGNKVGDYLGDAYKSLAREIADDVKNFQGKTIRSYDDAMASLNKVLSNPGFKFNRADSDALANVWRSIDAQDMANKLGNISKAFKFADVVMKVEKVREKSIEGYETGNWGPLMLEVESWVLSGIASAVALGVFSATLGAYALSLGAPAIAVGIVGILLAAVVGALIDDKFADALNKEIIKPAH
ncbi:colicin-like pore-forming protein [Escherichia coli]|uniref:colicin-like pore-forming protein n=1 Tax=Escherichia coli TaxID=562 RepID=UPI001BD21F95|nr:colicin-like pore-forming protein [Escherichia coli]